MFNHTSAKKLDPMYNRGMTLLRLYIEFDKAVENNAPQEELNPLKEKMGKQLSLAFENFSKVISDHFQSIADGSSNSPSESSSEVTSEDSNEVTFEDIKAAVKISLDQIEKNIEDIKKYYLVDREIMEMVLLKLSVLKDFSILGLKHIPKALISGVNNFIYTSIVKNKKINPEAINLFHDYSVLRLGAMGRKDFKVAPIYASSSAVGFRAFLFGLCQGYFSIGFGEKPYPVHDGLYKDSSFLTLRHDFSHKIAVENLKLFDPKMFDQYIATLDSLFKLKDSGKIGEIAFKKDLLIVYLLLHQLNYSPSVNNISAEEAIRDLTTIDPFPEQMPEEKRAKQIHNLIEHLIDFVVPLKKLGCQINFDKSKPLDFIADMQKILLEMFKDFTRHYPEIQLIPEENAQPQIGNNFK